MMVKLLPCFGENILPNTSQNRWHMWFQILQAAAKFTQSTCQAMQCHTLAAISGYNMRQASINLQNCKAECRGGFGVVLWGQVHREEAAIKLIKGRSREKEMLQEIAILERAKTNYVTRFLGYTVCPDGIMLCMEYMAGGTLYQALHINEEFQWRNRQAPWLLACPVQWSWFLYKGIRNYLFSLF